MKWLNFASTLLLLPVIHCLDDFGSSDIYTSAGPESIYQNSMRNERLYFQKVLNITNARPLKVVAVIGYIPNIEIKTVAPSRAPIVAIDGVKFIPDLTFDDDFDVDILALVAGTGPTPATSKFLRRVEPRVKKHIFTVCQGSHSIAASGLLNGHSATVTKAFYTYIKFLHPKVNWVLDARYVDSGRYISASGGAAGLDGVFYLISKLYGYEVAQKIAIINEYDWTAEPGDIMFSNNAKIYNPLIPNLLSKSKKSKPDKN